MTAFLNDLATRLFRTESLATIAAIALVVSGKVRSPSEAIAIVGAVGTLVAGRSYHKARVDAADAQAAAEIQSAIAYAAGKNGTTIGRVADAVAGVAAAETAP